jgi:hypothetical protein
MRHVTEVAEVWEVPVPVACSMVRVRVPDVLENVFIIRFLLIFCYLRTAMMTSSMETTPSTRNDIIDDHQACLSLLEKTQAMIELEKTLTETLEKVEPWLPNQTGHHPNRPRVRPIPTNMEEAKSILAVARTLASRTSAPAGWNPNAPVVGFSTPSPLPHQLRGGALAALQLERARQAERDTKRQRIQQQEEASAKKAADIEMAEAAPEQPEDDNTTTNRDPKRREVMSHEHQIGRTKLDLARVSQQQAQQRARVTAQPTQQMDVSMNLSESSSEEDDD